MDCFSLYIFVSTSWYIPIKFELLFKVWFIFKRTTSSKSGIASATTNVIWKSFENPVCSLLFLPCLENILCFSRVFEVLGKQHTQHLLCCIRWYMHYMREFLKKSRYAYIKNAVLSQGFVGNICPAAMTRCWLSHTRYFQDSVYCKAVTISFGFCSSWKKSPAIKSLLWYPH